MGTMSYVTSRHTVGAPETGAPETGAPVDSMLTVPLS